MIRPFQHGDHVAIAEIFTRAVHEIACEAYSEEQCLAWSDYEPNPAHWKRRCELKRPFVFLVDTEVAGFLELDPDGHIDCAYVHPKFQRRGIASALVRHAIETCFAFGLARVYVEASLCAKPMFEKLGFKVLQEVQANVRGVELANYKMELTSTGGQGSPMGG
jgi:ribosomal protein S18 acetylase RimI-like enzyme